VLPKSQHAAFDYLGLDAFERAVAIFYAVATLHVKSSLVLGAGQGGAFNSQLRDVGALVRIGTVRGSGTASTREARCLIYVAILE
jgi:hypothetical protein